MSIWISSPSIIIPEPGHSELKTEIDPVYERIFKAFSHDTTSHEEPLLLPQAHKMDREELAVSAIRLLLNTYHKSNIPKILVDCCSSAMIGCPAPTYKLAFKSGLTKVLPFALDGQAGSEVAYAFLFLDHMMGNTNGNSIISSVQKVVSPDLRIRENKFPLADAAAAISCSNERIKDGFKIKGIVCGQLVNSWDQTLNDILEKLLTKAGISKDLIKWTVAHRYSDQFLSVVQKTMHATEWLTRDLYPEFNFGCADVLISLNRLNNAPGFPIGTGILWFVGEFGSVGSVLVTYDDK